MSNSRDRDAASQRLNAFAPRCPKGDGTMRLWMLVPGRGDDLVTYRYDRCGTEVRRMIPR
jgi:hypothetical protein